MAYQPTMHCAGTVHHAGTVHDAQQRQMSTLIKLSSVLLDNHLPDTSTMICCYLYRENAVVLTALRMTAPRQQNQ